MKDEQEKATMGLSDASINQWTPPIARKLQKLEENKDIPKAVRENVVLPTPCFQTSSFQNSETINFCYFNLSVFGTSL